MVTGREFLRVLEEEAMGGIRVQLDEGTGYQACHEVRVPGQNHPVVIAVSDEYRLRHRAESLEQAVVRCSPLQDRVVLGVPGLPVGVRIPALRSAVDPAQELRARGSARGRVGEEAMEETLGVGNGLADGLDDVWCPAVHARCALRGGRRQDHLPDQCRPGESYLLRDETANGEPEQVDQVQSEGLEEDDRVVRHLGECGGSGPCGRAHAGVVEDDHVARR